MTRSKILTATSLIALSMAGLATSASAYDRVDARQARQESRIQQGLRTGQITRSEYRELEAEQARIARLERSAKADGRVDRYEAAQIRNAQNQASQHIRQEASDSDSRRRRWYRWW
jgi:membrane peptidoglycan carboxypeptidase